MIEFCDINYAIADEQIFKNFDLKIDKNEFVALSGESGRGKTTLLKIVVGLVRPQAGEIKILDQSLDVESIKKLRNQIFWLPQNVNLPVENLENILQILKIDTDKQLHKIKQNLKTFHLDFDILRYKKFEQLSQGQKQRILLAVCFASDKKIFLLDEPTSALDEASIHALLELVKKRLGVCILSISHNPTWNSHADRVVNL